MYVLEDRPENYGLDLDPRLYKRSDYTYDVSRQPYSDFEREAKRCVDKFIGVRIALNRYSRLKPDRFMFFKNKNAFLTPPSSGRGYLTFRDPLYWNFVKDVHDALLKEVSENEKELVRFLSVNYAKVYPYYILIHHNRNFEVDQRYYDLNGMEAARMVYAKYGFESLRRATGETVHVRAKKTTSMGFPYETVDGRPINREDIYYALEKNAHLMKTRARRDESVIKKGWLRDPRGCPRIFRDQVQMMGRDISPSMVPELMDRNIITVVNPSRRSNNPDVPIYDGDLMLNSTIYCKDRDYAVFMPDDIEIGMINSKRINEIANKVTGMPGCCNRLRYIYPSNNVAHYMGTLLATAYLHDVEKGSSGMPANRPAIISRWRNFFDAHEADWDIFLISMDCKNGELTVTSNFQLFLKLVPHPIDEYLDLTSMTVQPTTAGYYVGRNAYCSAVWFTTFEHIHKGNFEGIRILYDTLARAGIPLPPFTMAVTSHLECLFQAAPWAEIGENVRTCPFLGTDDILFPFAVRKRFNFNSQPDVTMLEKTNMSAEIGKGPFVRFGMSATSNDLTENISSRIKSLFTTEHMGFCLRDGMSTYERIHGCGYTDVIDFFLRKHFGYTHQNYYPLLELYKQYLSELGVKVEDVINFYSPTERLIYGDLVSDDPIADSSALEPEEVDDMLFDLKSVFLP